MNAETTYPDGNVVTRWTRSHILLHWAAALLIGTQFVSGQWMSTLFAGKLGGDVDGAAASYLGPLHIALGTLVFALVAARVRDRVVHGRPPHPPGEPVWARRLATVTQFALYALVLLMPVAGLVAWFGESESIGDAHAIAAKLLFALLALHVAGALANHYWFKTDVLRRMLPGHGRRTRGSRQPSALTVGGARDGRDG